MREYRNGGDKGGCCGRGNGGVKVQIKGRSSMLSLDLAMMGKVQFLSVTVLHIDFAKQYF